MTIFGDRPGSKNRNRRDFGGKKIFGKIFFWLVLEWVTPSGTHFVLKFRFRAQLSEIGKKKMFGLVLEGVTIFGDRPGSKNRNRRDLGEKKFRKKKKIFWLVLEWVTPSGTLFVLKFQFRAQLSEIG